MTEALPKAAVIAVVGAGTMGRGIAQVAAAAGHTVLLYDTADGVAARARASVAEDLARLVGKGKLPAADRDAVLTRLQPRGSLSDLAAADLVIEAVVEDLSAKRQLFAELERICSPRAILASNTSSLSITAIAAPLRHPARCIGMHFFNPAPVMALVEVVSGLATDPAVAATVEATAAAWGKLPVRAASTPGFIVNRVARPFYGEALQLLEERAADPATIDAVLREAGGFPMGPFELMDLVGNDVNAAVTRSVYDGFFQDPRFKPSAIQQELVAAGRLGRKSGRGFYDYTAGAVRPEPATLPRQAAPSRVAVLGASALLETVAALAEAAGMRVERQAGDGMLQLDGAKIAVTDGRTATERAAADNLENLVLLDLALDFASARRVALAAADQADPRAMGMAAGLFQALGKAVSPIDDVPGMIVLRTVAMLANEAAYAVHQGVATARAVDIAMTKGVNYPKGPLAWAEEIGLDRILFALDMLARTYGGGCYRASALLRRKVWGGTRFHA